jgi:hypothetical protein
MTGERKIAQTHIVDAYVNIISDHMKEADLHFQRNNNNNNNSQLKLVGVLKPARHYDLNM